MWGERLVGSASFHLLRRYNDDLPAEKGESHLDQVVNGSDGHPTRPDQSAHRAGPTLGTKSPYNWVSMRVYQATAVFAPKENI